MDLEKVQCRATIAMVLDSKISKDLKVFITLISQRKIGVIAQSRIIGIGI